jgi:hypothetical protein
VIPADFTDGRVQSKIIASKISVEKCLPGSVDRFKDEFFKNPPDLPPVELAMVTDRGGR